MANANRYFKTPFAESGNRAEVPDVGAAGAVGYESGFGPNYELPQGNPSRLRIERDLYNGIHHSITSNLKQWQEKNYPTWIEDDGTAVAFAYDKDVIVNHSGENWISSEDANQDEPGVGAKWSRYTPSVGGAPNLLQNHNFTKPGDLSQPTPDATPRSYAPGFEVFSGWFADDSAGITNLTLVDGEINFTAGTLYQKVPKTGALVNLTDFNASVKSVSGPINITGVTFSLISDDYVIVIDSTAVNVFSVKFQEGPVADSHSVSIAESSENKLITFSSTDAMKVGKGISTADLNLFDISAMTQGYNGGWAVSLEPIGAAKYLLSTLQRVRDAKGDQLWVPDGAVDFYILGGVEFVATIQLTTQGLHVEQAGAKGNDQATDGQALFDANAWVVADGINTLLLGANTYIVSNKVTLSAGVYLKGVVTNQSIIKQINTASDGLKLSGGCRISDLRIEAPAAGTSLTTIGLDASDTSDITVTNVRILHFGKGVNSTGLTWRQTYTNVRVEEPRHYGFYFSELAQHLEIFLTSCYVVNTSILGSNSKVSYYIYGSQGTTMNQCTSDGGFTVGETTLGADIRESIVTMTMPHWEGYTIKTGAIPGAEYDSIIRAEKSTVTINGIRFVGVYASVPQDDCLIYAESESKISITGLEMDSATLLSFSSQHTGLSNDFGNCKIEVETSNSAMLLGRPRGTGAGAARSVREGNLVNQTISGSTVINVNTISDLVLFGTSGQLTGFIGGHSEGQTIGITWRQAGVTVVNSPAFKLQGGVDFVATVNATQLFRFSAAGDFFAEVSRI